MSLTEFMRETRSVADKAECAADCVDAVAPLMLDLLKCVEEFLEPKHLRPSPDGYARNAIAIDKQGGPSLYALVWTPGQWTPVHDHGTWGVVGIVKGVLEERNFIRMDPCKTIDHDIDLARGGPILLGKGTVTTFVPNPDHIHMTGVPEDREQVVSLHLYGKEMNAFHIYDQEARSRKRIEVFHNES